MERGGRCGDPPAEAGHADLIERLYRSLARGDSPAAELVIRETSPGS